MVGIIDGFRWSILGGRTPVDVDIMVSSVVVTIVCLLLGMWYFRRTERGFADAI
jgi:lipopolysaccharide transport system permease protein